jgi:predicted dithiol-disulfide oxidoreductase (DUF899 family)
MTMGGQDPRHIGMIWPLWNLLDLTPEGRGSDWRPTLSSKAGTDPGLSLVCP